VGDGKRIGTNSLGRPCLKCDYMHFQRIVIKILMPDKGGQDWAVASEDPMKSITRIGVTF
jgi:hypothetical protein